MPPHKLSPEFEALLNKLVDNIRDVSRQENQSLARQITSEFSAILDRRLQIIEDRLFALRSEFRGDIEKLKAEIVRDLQSIKAELGEQSKTLRDHSVEIATIKERLQDGDRWMREHEIRVDKVEEKETESRISIAYIAGKIGPSLVGGGVAAAIVKMLEHGAGH